MPARQPPSWAPWALLGVGVFGLLMVGIAAAAGQFGLTDWIILIGSVVVIVSGVRKLRGR